MKTKDQVAKIQRSFNLNVRRAAHDFVAGLPKAELAAVLLSGSTARGDFYPGRFGGMVDLTVMPQDGSNATAAELFGENEEPAIPFHCVKRDGAWYQIAFHEFVDHRRFQSLDESKKFALLESEVLWEQGKSYTAELDIVQKFARVDQARLKGECLGYVGYLLSDYKEDRWLRREAYAQLHANLNAALQGAIKCLFYLNGSYAPAEDRRLYYAHALPRLPDGFASLMRELHRQDIDSESDYRRRRRSFESVLLAFINKSGAKPLR